MNGKELNDVVFSAELDTMCASTRKDEHSSFAHSPAQTGNRIESVQQHFTHNGTNAKTASCERRHSALRAVRLWFSSRVSCADRSLRCALQTPQKYFDFNVRLVRTAKHKHLAESLVNGSVALFCLGTEKRTPCSNSGHKECSHSSPREKFHSTATVCLWKWSRILRKGILISGDSLTNWRTMTWSAIIYLKAVDLSPLHVLNYASKDILLYICAAWMAVCFNIYDKISYFEALTFKYFKLEYKFKFSS